MIADGARWSSDAVDAQMSDDVLACFDTPAGVRALAYLRKITLNRVLQPTATDAELRHHEGARGLVAIIDMRMDDARSRRRAAADPDASPRRPGRNAAAARAARTGAGSPA